MAEETTPGRALLVEVDAKHAGRNRAAVRIRKRFWRDGVTASTRLQTVTGRNSVPAPHLLQKGGEISLTAANQHETERHYDALYEQYGKPLEQEHTGEYLAISPDGRIVLGSTLLEVAQKASDTLGSGHFLFKVGERSVGKWR